jgi:hypothetical protein
MIGAIITDAETDASMDVATISPCKETVKMDSMGDIKMDATIMAATINAAAYC